MDLRAPHRRLSRARALRQQVRKVAHGVYRERKAEVLGVVTMVALLWYFLVVRVWDRSLIVYIYFPKPDDAEFGNNFKYFVREGIKAGDGNDYVVVVQEPAGQPPTAPLPQLPANARYLRHNNSCFDIGTIGWVLDHHVRVGRYRYFFFINSGVRGPFLPAWASGLHWTTPFTARLNRVVKMVGPTLNCGRAFEEEAVPHVQTYMWAVDRTGLDTLRSAGVFGCWEDWKQAVVKGELGAARALFAAGYSIDTLMYRYQGIDWRESRGFNCNAGFQPIQHGFYDGINVEPFEVIFVKVKSEMLQADWAAAKHAVRYDAWSAAAALPPPQREAMAASNAFEALAPEKLAAFEARGERCFNASFYIGRSYDLRILLKEPDVQHAAWEHFLANGYYEGRLYHFTC